LTTLADLQPPLITVTRTGQVEWLWDLDHLTLATKSLVDQKVGERIVEENGAEYRIEATRIVGRAPGSLFERIVTVMDPAVDLDLSIVPTSRVVPVDELKLLVLKSKDIRHSVSSGWGSTAPFRKQVELAGDVPALFAVLKHYFPPPRPRRGRRA
jgi:hypothetical protein